MNADHGLLQPRNPCESARSVSSASSPIRLLDMLDVKLRAVGAQLHIDIVTAAVDLLHIPNRRRAVGGQRDENQGHAGADVRAGHRPADKAAGADDHSAMGNKHEGNVSNAR